MPSLWVWCSGIIGEICGDYDEVLGEEHSALSDLLLCWRRSYLCRLRFNRNNGFLKFSDLISLHRRLKLHHHTPFDTDALYHHHLSLWFCFDFTGRWVVSNWIGVQIRISKSLLLLIRFLRLEMAALMKPRRRLRRRRNMFLFRDRPPLRLRLLRITLGGLNLVSMSFPLTIRLVKSWLSPAWMQCAECASWEKAKEVREQGGCFLVKAVARSTIRIV